MCIKTYLTSSSCSVESTPILSSKAEKAAIGSTIEASPSGGIRAERMRICVFLIRGTSTGTAERIYRALVVCQLVQIENTTKYFIKSKIKAHVYNYVQSVIIYEEKNDIIEINSCHPKNEVFFIKQKKTYLHKYINELFTVKFVKFAINIQQ